MLESVEQSATNCEILAKIIDTENRRKQMERLEALFSNQNKEIEELLCIFQIEDTRYPKYHLAELNTAREEETAWQHMTEECRYCESLRNTDYQFHKEKNPGRIPKTCRWFLNHPKYQEWLFWDPAHGGEGGPKYKTRLRMSLKNTMKQWSRALRTFPTEPTTSFSPQGFSLLSASIFHAEVSS